MKPNPLVALDIPAEWPKHGTFKGKKISLTDAWATLTYVQLAGVEVDIPAQGKRTPWRHSDMLADFEIPKNTIGLLPRESLAYVSLTDAMLEAWAETKGIVLDLGGDDSSDIQSIRADAFRRYMAEQPHTDRSV